MLKRQDLRPGDIMCQFFASTVAGAFIAAGQALTGNRNSKIVHAGILFDSNYMVEALAKGIQAADLRIQNRPYHYMVYRPVNPRLAQGAADCANMMLQINHSQKSLSYNTKGAIASIFGTSAKPKTAGEMDALLDQILAGKDRPFFCSQFVVYVYQFVAEQSGMSRALIFNLSDPKVPPARLADYMETSPNFKLVGELPSNAR
jgi:hypothetical protein